METGGALKYEAGNVPIDYKQQKHINWSIKQTNTLKGSKYIPILFFTLKKRCKVQ